MTWPLRSSTDWMRPGTPSRPGHAPPPSLVVVGTAGPGTDGCFERTSLDLDEVGEGLLEPVDGGLEPLGFGHLPLVQREPLDRPAVREVGPRLMVVLADDPTDAQDGPAVAGQDDIALVDPPDEVEDLVGRPA